MSWLIRTSQVKLYHPATTSKIIQSQSKLYHGSRKKFPDGFILTPQSDGYVTQQRDFEVVFEKYRPENILSRFESVFMVDDYSMIDYAGGYDDHIYLVEPVGQIYKSDLAWYTEFESFWLGENPEDGDMERTCATSYWNGVPYKNPENSLWEYRARSAKIVMEVELE